MDAHLDKSSRLVQSGGWLIHLRESGSGQPLLLLHNTGPGASGWHSFSRCIEQLSESFRVLAVDLPGWGKSDVATPKTGRNHVAAVHGLLDALAIDRVALVGNSRGGRVALTFAALYPERVSHLITAGASTPGTDVFSVDEKSDGADALRAAYESPTLENFRQLVSTMVFDQSQTEGQAEMLLASALDRPEHLANWLAFARDGAGGVGGPPDLVQRLSSMTCPTLVLHGLDDRSIHFEHALRLVRIVPGAELVLFNGCGHWIQVERPDEFARLAEGFIRHH